MNIEKKLEKRINSIIQLTRRISKTDPSNARRIWQVGANYVSRGGNKSEETILTVHTYSCNIYVDQVRRETDDERSVNNFIKKV